jgi:large subunit ribosomal protein L10
VEITPMSKKIKQMQMDALKKTFIEVRDMVFLSYSGINAIAENQMRLALRKKNVRLHMVKNSLANRVFKDMGFTGDFAPILTGPTIVAWGGASIADLTKELAAFLKKHDKIKPKAALADGAIISFDQAKKFPTRAEALGRVAGMAIGPGGRILSQLRGPASTVAAQVKQLSEKKEEAPAAAAS